MADILIDPNELNFLQLNHISTPLTIIDGTFKLFSMKQNWDSDYRKERIPGARFFHNYFISNKEAQVDYMLPDPIQWKQFMKELDIGVNDCIVCYSKGEIYGATRVWWALKTYGCTNVKILNGGIENYKKLGFTLEKGEKEYGWKSQKRKRKDKDFKFKFQEQFYTRTSDILKLINGEQCSSIKKDAQLIDTRPKIFYYCGHVPGAKNCSYSNLVQDGGSTFKTPEEILKILESYGISIDKPIVVQCQIGVSSTVLLVAAMLVGVTDISNHDGSWSEYKVAEGGAKAGLSGCNIF